MKNEICICSAIKTTTGFIIRGQRHSDCFRTATGIKALTLFEIDKAEQGFITSKNRFVDRKEGLKLQRQAGIEPFDNNGSYRSDELFSEDLY